MAAPKFVPVTHAARTAAYESPEVVPSPWQPTRPAELQGRQPSGERLGYQGPDQGYALRLAELTRDRLKVSTFESKDDAIGGCLGIALRRASLYGRAPVMHDLTIAFSIWGFFDDNPPKELREVRERLFEGAGHPHHYVEARHIADIVPEETLRKNPAEVGRLYPANWRALTGA